MSWLENFMGGNNNSMNDRDIALNMLASSKAGVGMLSAALVETTNPELRQMLSSQLTASISGHFQLSDMAIRNGWYNAYDQPLEQIHAVSEETKNIIK